MAKHDRTTDPPNNDNPCLLANLLQRRYFFRRNIQPRLAIAANFFEIDEHLSAREGTLVKEGAEHDSTVSSLLRCDQAEVTRPNFIMLSSMLEQASFPCTRAAGGQAGPSEC